MNEPCARVSPAGLIGSYVLPEHQPAWTETSGLLGWCGLGWCGPGWCLID
jgi:hypothetical protein